MAEQLTGKGGSPRGGTRTLCSRGELRGGGAGHMLRSVDRDRSGRIFLRVRH